MLDAFPFSDVTTRESGWPSIPETRGSSLTLRNTVPPDHRRAEATPSFGRLCRAMTVTRSASARPRSRRGAAPGTAAAPVFRRAWRSARRSQNPGRRSQSGKMWAAVRRYPARLVATKTVALQHRSECQPGETHSHVRQEGAPRYRFPCGLSSGRYHSRISYRMFTKSLWLYNTCTRFSRARCAGSREASTPALPTPLNGVSDSLSRSVSAGD